MKARFKTILLSAIGVIAAFSTMTYTSCNNDKCKAIVCAYGGVCDDGNCICPSGYEGVHCEVVTRDKYKGVWTVFEKGNSTLASEYDLSIDYSIDGNTSVIIRGFYNKFFDDPVDAKVISDSLIIPFQVVEGYEIEGWGTLDWDRYYPDHGELEVHYTIKNPEGKVNDFGVNTGVPSRWYR